MRKIHKYLSIHFHLFGGKFKWINEKDEDDLLQLNRTFTEFFEDMKIWTILKDSECPHTDFVKNVQLKLFKIIQN